MQKTTVAKPTTVKQDWWVVDGADQVVGRLAVKIATILMGKNKPIYTPHVDCGDYVVVTNCEKVAFTGAKWDKKIYRHHTGHIGGLVEESASRLLKRHPDRILRLAVRRMLPKTKLGRQMLKKLKLVVGSEHGHVAQQPKPLDIDCRRK